MSDLTSREVSQRLKKAGFSIPYQYGDVAYFRLRDLRFQNVTKYYEPQKPEDWVDRDITNEKEEYIHPAYSASTLLDWLQKNGWVWYEITITDTGNVFFIILGKTITPKRIDFNGSWPDLFAEAVIFVLTQEKEKK
jgi:hypothetical protein